MDHQFNRLDGAEETGNGKITHLPRLVRDTFILLKSYSKPHYF